MIDGNGGRDTGHAATRRSGKLTAAGILNIVGGCLNVLGGIFVTIAALVIGTLDNASDAGLFRVFMTSIGVLIIAAGVVGIVSAVYIWRRQYWGLALAGAILTLLFGWVLLLPSMLGIAAIILVSLSQKEFG